MLPKRNKITKKLFSESFLTSMTVGNAFFTLKFKPISGSHSKVSFVVSKAVAKMATSRNVIKRRGYEATEPFLKKIKNPYILMFFAKKGAEKTDFSTISRSIEELLRKIKPPLF